MGFQLFLKRNGRYILEKENIISRDKKVAMNKTHLVRYENNHWNRGVYESLAGDRLKKIISFKLTGQARTQTSE